MPSPGGQSLPALPASRSAAALPEGMGMMMDPLAPGQSTLSIGTSGQSSRVRSAAVLARSYQHRESLREHMRQQEEAARMAQLKARYGRERAWRQKMAGSPYTVNLVGEAERITEEMRVKQELEAWRKQYEERERERLRNEVVQSAMADAHKLQQLHRDKMAVQLEQKRLRALRDVQRSEARALTVAGDIRRRVVAQQVARARHRGAGRPCRSAPIRPPPTHPAQKNSGLRRDTPP